MRILFFTLLLSGGCLTHTQQSGECKQWAVYAVDTQNSEIYDWCHPQNGFLRCGYRVEGKDTREVAFYASHVVAHRIKCP